MRRSAGGLCILVSFVTLVLLVVTGCGVAGGDTPQSIRVVASIYPLAYFAERVGGENVDVQVLVRPGVEAHAFEPTPRDLQAMKNAQIVIVNGLGLERWIDRALEASGSGGSRTVVEAADPARAIAGDHHEGEEPEDVEHEDEEHEGEEEVNPHMWLDPLLAIRQVERIRDALVSIDSIDAANAAAYTANAASLIDDLRGLDREFTAALASCKHDHFVTTHAAYAYLAKRYGLEEIPISGVSEEAEPSPRELAGITARVKALGLRHVLAEPALSKRLAETVAAESDLTMLSIHPIESATDDELQAHGDYFGLMRDNLRSLKIALECQDAGS